MTKAKPIEEMQRPRRKISTEIRFAVFCPACGPDLTWKTIFEVRVVAYRQRVIRFECKQCATRWTMSYDDVRRAVERRMREAAQVRAEAAD